MKFSATFAVLAVFVAKAAVIAAPTPATTYDSLVEARAEFVESALEEVWARFYDELLDNVEARDYSDEEIYERSPMKKFGQDLVTNLAQKAPSLANQYSQGEQAKARHSTPRMASVVQQAQAQHKSGLTPPPKPLAPVKPLPADSKWNTVKKPSVMAEIKKQGLDKFGKKRSLEALEEYLFERAPMKKFGTDLVTNLAQKAPSIANQYSQGEQAKARHSTPRMASIVQQAQAQHKSGGMTPPPASKPLGAVKWHTVKKPSVMEEIKKQGLGFGKKRSIQFADEELWN